MLPDTRADSPQFDFDSSSLHPGGASILDEVADCVLTGSLKGDGDAAQGISTRPKGRDGDQASARVDAPRWLRVALVLLGSAFAPGDHK